VLARVEKEHEEFDDGLDELRERLKDKRMPWQQGGWQHHTTTGPVGLTYGVNYDYDRTPATRTMASAALSSSPIGGESTG
jgi:hypothetical protein